jgi:pre-rRNA-processing protein IPI1
MGKGIKRKNAGVGVDFRKVKHKVGRKLPKAANETRTDFTSRSIALPTQSLAAERGGAAVSERNLTLKVRPLQHNAWRAATARHCALVLHSLVLPAGCLVPCVN